MPVSFLNDEQERRYWALCWRASPGAAYVGFLFRCYSDPLLWWHDANYTFSGRYTKNPYLGSGVMRTCFFCAEKRNHLPVEGGQIRRLPTADPVAVSDHFTVYPLAAGKHDCVKISRVRSFKH